MEKTFLYRWIHIPSRKTGTRERRFISEKAFLACLEYWNSYVEWKYYPVQEPDKDNHTSEKEEIYTGPFQFYGI